MKYLRCQASNLSVWAEGTFLKRAMVEDDIYVEFIAWQAEHDPCVEWIEEDFEGKNKYYKHNIKSAYGDEWTCENGKWKLMRRIK